MIVFPAFSNIDSLILVTQSRQDTNAVLAGYELGKAMVGRNIDSSYMFLIEAANLADKLDYTHGKIVTYRSIGSVAPRIGKYDESLTWLNKGIVLIDSLDLPVKNKVDFLTNIGVAHYRVGLTGKAIETYIEAVAICRENGLDEQRSRLLNNLGIFYRSLKRYDEAQGIYEQSYELRLQNKDSVGMANILFNMAAAYSKIDDHQNTILRLEKAETIYREMGREADAVHCVIAKGTAYQDLDEIVKAHAEFEIAKTFPYDKLGVPFNFSLYNGLATVSLHKGKLSQAEGYLNKIADEVINSDFVEQITIFYELRAELYHKKGLHKKAFDNLITLRELESTVSEEENASFRQEMETKYLTSEKEYEIELLNTQNELTETKLSAARMRNIGLGMGLLVFTSLLIWLYRLYSTTKEQKEVITIANQDKDLLLKEIHHRVKNNLQVISSLLSLQSKYVEDENAVSALNEGQNRVESMARIHQNLYRDDNISGVNMKNYIPLLANSIFNSYNIQGEDIKIEYDIDEIRLDVATVIPIGLVLNELISNALKYAFPNEGKGVLKVSLLEKSDAILLSVVDNGIGIGDNEVASGFGTKLIRSFTRKLEGELKIVTENGTAVEILIKNFKRA